MAIDFKEELKNMNIENIGKKHFFIQTYGCPLVEVKKCCKI